MQGEYRTALDYHTEALKIRRSSGNVRLIAASYYNMAIAMEGLGYAREALRYHKLSLELEEQIGNKRGEIISYNGMGRLYTSLSEFATAEKYLKRAEKMIFEIGAEDELRETYLFYSDLYERQGNTSKALDYFKKYKVVTDSVFNESALRQITEIQALYEIEKKEKEIALLNQQNEWNELQMAQQASQIRQQRWLLILGAGFFLLLAGFAVIIYNYYLQKSRTNEELTKLNKEILEQQEEITAQSEELREANDMIVGFNTELKLKVEHQTYELRQAYQDLDTFFYRSSHDFRRPLTTLMGLSKVAQLSVTDPVSLDLFQKVNETVVAMDRMLSKLHAFSNLGIEDLPIETLDFETKLEAFKKAFSDEIQQKNLTFTYRLDLKKPVRTYALLIHVLLENLIENAIIFNSHQGRVHVEIRFSDQNLQVEVSDNGIGINQELLDSVFEMYLRGSEQSKGNGLGLYLANKVVTRLKGQISVDSILNEGTTFRVTIPIT
jgi:signal transduction histidine kinase